MMYLWIYRLKVYVLSVIFSIHFENNEFMKVLIFSINFDTLEIMLFI
jgi:hypothetical protein